MISVSLLKKKARRKYWEVLRFCLQGKSLFPLIIPADKNLPGNFEAMRQAIGDLVENAKTNKGYGYRLAFAERNTRKHGTQTIPTRISFETGDDFFKFINKKKEAEKILRTAEEICSKLPVLKSWTEQNPQKIFKYLDDWAGIINVALYFRQNPRPNKYARELPINVHTKFIEEHRGILQELLEYIIPGHINREGNTFEKRFHLKSPEPLIRIRRLDSNIDKSIFIHSPDVAFPIDAFNHLESQCQFVVITENQMTFLTLPPMKNTIAILGGGFKAEILKEAVWLKSKTIIYWGDIDMHGFLILALVRGYFPGVISIMMDRETFLRFRDRCGQGAGSQEQDEKELKLTPQELNLYHLVREGNHRLEQEHLPQEYIAAQFYKLFANFSSGC